MRVPARPARIAAISSGAPMTPTAPGVHATMSATAATFGSMLPAPNSPLMVSVNGNRITVSLATNATGGLKVSN